MFPKLLINWVVSIYDSWAGRSQFPCNYKARDILRIFKFPGSQFLIYVNLSSRERGHMKTQEMVHKTKLG
jgi:hypothetical protein